MTSLALSLVLSAAPLLADYPEVLGWTKDGANVVWLEGARKDKAVAMTAVVFNVRTAHDERYDFELRPTTGAAKPGADHDKFEAWKKEHPLEKLESLEGVTADTRIGGKPARSWGGDGKVAAPELFTQRYGVKQTMKSGLAEYKGAKLPTTKASWYFDPGGRRVLFELHSEAAGEDPPVSELVIVPAGPTVFLLAPDLTPAAREPQSDAIENAGFAVTGWDQNAKPPAQTVVSAAPALKTQADALAKALSAKLESKSPRGASVIQVTAKR
ncbi:MAG: LytR C-terminal domain-containing protein [Myxococcaceae bacterium]